MGAFTDKVRAATSPIKQPTQRGFSTTSWADAYQRLAPHDAEDNGVFDAGNWFFAKFETIRAELRKSGLPAIGRSELVRLVVGAVTTEYIKIKRNHIRQKPGTMLWAEELAQKREVELSDGPENADIVVEQHLEGALHVLRLVLQQPNEPYNCNGLNEASSVARIEKLLSLGALYGSLEDYWSEVLWNGWRLVSRDDVTVISAPADGRAAEIAVSAYRRDLGKLQEALRAVAGWQALSPEEKRRWSECLHVDILNSGKHREYRISRLMAAGRMPPMPVLLRVISSKAYYAGFYGRPLPGLSGVTPNNLLEVWELLYALSDAHAEHFPVCLQARKPNTLRQYAPQLPVATLCSLVARSIPGINRATASRIIDFLTFDERKKVDLWVTPLVRVDAKHVAWFTSSVMTSNLARAVETWLKIADADLNEKGRSFEDDAKAQIARSAKRSALLKNCGVHPGRLVLRVEGEQEEVDVVLWIGRTLLMGEAKCVHFPAEPLERYHYYDTLDHAAEQIRRKAALAERYLESLAQQLGLKDIPQRVVPFILTNQPHGVGFARKGIAVTDLDGLRSYIEHGCLHCCVQVHIDRGVTGPAYVRDYYASELEAEENIRSYLLKPPVISDYEKSVQIYTYHWPPINETDTKTAIERPEVRLAMDAGRVVPLAL